MRRIRKLLGRALAIGAFATVSLPLAPGCARADEAPAAPAPENIPELEAIVFVPEFGQFVIHFDRNEVPNHVAHFLTLTAEGFYDGLAFHRVIPGYLVQAGHAGTREDNPDGSPTDRSPIPYRLPAEETARTHERGTVAMAWDEDRPGTTGSQWFVVLDDVPALDGHATPIGRVVRGLDVVERISQVPALRSRLPRRPVRIESILLNVETPSEISSDGASDAAGEPQSSDS